MGRTIGGMAKGDGKSDKTDKPDKSGKGAKSEKTDKRFDKVLRLATNRIETIESSTTVAETTRERRQIQ